MNYRAWMLLGAACLAAATLASCKTADTGEMGTGTAKTADTGGTGTGTAAAAIADVQPDMTVQGTLSVFVPCGMAGPYGEVKQLFQARYPNVTMELDLRNVDVQAAGIEDGKDAPDAWLSLGDAEITRAQEAGRLDGEPVTFAYNSLALIVAKGNPCDIRSPEDLLKPEVRTIALPTNRNSSGLYMQQALEAQGLWEALRPKLWLTDEPSAVKRQLGHSKADVGVVYYPCAKEAKKVGGEPEDLPTETEMLGELPEDLVGRIPVQAAVVKGCKNPDLGRLFIEFLLEEPCQDVWEAWDFGRAVEKPGAELVAATLHLYCGAGIQPYAEAAIAAFKRVQPSVEIVTTYAGSGCLLSQLTFAKRGDLYMPGEDYYLAQARDRGYIAEERLVGYFEPVILVAEGDPEGVGSLDGLAAEGLRVGICEPEAAAVGIAARDLLQAAGLYDAVDRNVIVHAGNVPELGNAVQLGTLDAAIVWNVTASPIADKTDVIEIPREYWEPSAVSVCVLGFSKAPEAARAFIDFCASEEGQRIAAAAGFTPADGGATS